MSAISFLGYVARDEAIAALEQRTVQILGDSSLVIGLVSAAILAVAGLAIATRTFQRESA